MMVFPVLAVSFFLNLVAALFIGCGVVLILIVLIQKGRGGGLGAAFGGGLASGILGSKTGDFLTWVTIAAVGLFLVLAVVVDKFYKPTITGPAASPPRATQPMPTQQQQPQAPPSIPYETEETGEEGADANSPGG